MYCADNGASGEGGPDGSVNENKFFNNWPDDIEENLTHLDDLGSPNTYNHYPTGWAVGVLDARSRCSSATRTRAARATRWSSTGRRGSRRAARSATSTTTSTDIVPTILDCCGVEMPDVVDGHEQVPLVGHVDALHVRRRRRRRAEDGQYYCMLGTRGMWEDGWKVVAVHGPTSGIGNFDKDEWELYHVDEDRAEAQGSGRRAAGAAARRSSTRWFEEAEKYDVLPLDDRLPVEILTERPAAGRGAARHLRLLPRTPPRCRRSRRVEHPRALVPRCSPRSSSRAPTPRA